MAIVNGITAEKMLEIAGENVQSGFVDIDGRLILEKRNGDEFDAGEVRGPQGLSAYDLWLADGNTGTLEDFLETLRAKNSVRSVGEYFDIPSGMDVPPYALVRDGSEVSRSLYGSLFAAIGTDFGPGDGSTTFNLPNDSRLRPVFHTTIGGGSIVKSGAATYTKVTWVAPTVNVGGHYNTALSRFVAPLDGIYEFTASIVQNTTVGGPIIVLYKNGVILPGDALAIAYDDYETASGTRAVELVAGDYVEVFIVNANGTSITVGGYGMAFSGKYLGENVRHPDVTPCIVATDQGSAAGVTIVNGMGGNALGQIVDRPVGAVLGSNELAMGQTVSATTYSGLAALYPDWLDDGDLVLPAIPSDGPRGKLREVTNTSGFSTTSSSGVDVTGMTDTLDLDPNRKYRVVITLPQVYNATGGRHWFQVQVGGVGKFTGYEQNAGYGAPHVLEVPFTGNGSTIIKLRTAADIGGGTLVFYADSSSPMRMEFFDDGPVAPLMQKVIIAADGAGEWSPTVQSALTSRVTTLEQKPFARLRIPTTGASGIPTTVHTDWTAFTVVDIGEGVDTSVSGKFVIEREGWYRVKLSLAFIANSTNFRLAVVRKNGSGASDTASFIAYGPGQLGNTTLHTVTTTEVTAYLVPGDVLTPNGWQNSGGTLGLVALASSPAYHMSFFEVEWIRS